MLLPPRLSNGVKVPWPGVYLLDLELAERLRVIHDHVAKAADEVGSAQTFELLLLDGIRVRAEEDAPLIQWLTRVLVCLENRSDGAGGLDVAANEIAKPARVIFRASHLVAGKLNLVRRISLP